MTLSDFRELLSTNPGCGLLFRLPSGKAVAPHFHVTEIGRVTKDFIDCGGTARSSTACVLQTWVANDTDHRLTTEKLAKIISLADSLFASANPEVEIEHEDGVISQFPVTSAALSDGVLTFRLGSKHTDCLAKEKCGLDGSDCCGSGESCCDAEPATIGGGEFFVPSKLFGATAAKGRCC
jgi:hypothetical protein